MSSSYLNQYFDHIYVANLKKRPDRKIAMLQKLQRLGIRATFIEAIDGYSKQNREEFQHYLEQPLGGEGSHPLERKTKKKLIRSPGAWGNLKTFSRIIQDARRYSYERILCFEDDAIFHQDFETRFKELTSSHIPADWKLLYLGATQLAWDIPQRLRYPDPAKTAYDPHEPFYFPVRTDGAFAIGIHRSVFELITAETLAMDCTFDSGPLQEVMQAFPTQCFVLQPNLVIADVRESDIRPGKDQFEFARRLNWHVAAYEFPFRYDLVSVIMPAYNARETIEKAIRSILSQDYQELELIVVDNASTDGTAKVVREMMEEDSRVRLISLDAKKSQGEAKNEGLKAAKGSVITFQQAYEISLPSRLTRQLIPIYEKGVLFTVCLSDQGNCKMEELSTAVFHRSVFNQYGMFEGILFDEELEFVERLLFHKALLAFSSESNGRAMLKQVRAIPRVFECIDDVLHISPAREKRDSTKQTAQQLQERLSHEEAFRIKYKSNGLNAYPKLGDPAQDEMSQILYPTLSLKDFSINPEWKIAAPSRVGKSLEKKLKLELTQVKAELWNVHHSLSWKATAPVRKVIDFGLSAFHAFKKESKLKVVYFYHMPKCGGTYMLRLLKEFQKATRAEFRSFNNLTEDKTIPQFDKDIKQFIKSIEHLPKDKVMLIHHHHGYPGIAELRELLEEAKKAVHKRGGEMIICGMVRKPLPFSISLLNYTNRTTEENLIFQDVIDKKEEYNHLSKYLLFNHPGRWDHSKMSISKSEIDKHVQVFDYLFPIEKMQTLIAMLNDFLGTNKVTIQRIINQTEWKLLPTPEEEEKIISVNQLDQYLYDLAEKNAISHVKRKSLR